MIRNDVQILDGVATLPAALETIKVKEGRGQSAAPDVVRVGVIGYGYWGPNIVRNLHGLDVACLIEHQAAR